VKKILGLTFLIMVVSILYGKSYVSNLAMQFIDDEYDYMQKANTTTPYEPTWIDTFGDNFNDPPVNSTTEDVEDSDYTVENATEAMPSSIPSTLITLKATPR
jgi:hypothetical protein